MKCVFFILPIASAPGMGNEHFQTVMMEKDYGESSDYSDSYEERLDEDFERADDEENNVQEFNVESDEGKSKEVSDSSSSTLKILGIIAACCAVLIGVLLLIKNRQSNVDVLAVSPREKSSQSNWVHIVN